MTLGSFMRGLLATLTPASLAVLLFCALPLAYADDADIKFLQVLQDAGIHATNGDDAVLIEAGHQVFAKRQSGETERAAINDVKTGSNVDNFTGYQVVAAAELNYCPQYLAAYHPGQQ
jgi:Protein of unknown function (DUF732)